MWTLDKSLGFLTTRTARSLKRALDAKLVEHGLTATQYIVLVRLWEEDGIPLTQLGELLFLDNPTITGIADRMERDGLLERRRNGDDRRVVNVYLTKKGKDLRRQVGTLAEETDAEAGEGFSESQMNQLLEQLNRIWKQMNEGLG
ncbi:MAG TPA: MarR family transcriptional regulator [Bacteroidetes bacterium]|nr:MarR family transcriptional regulator [Bacteroidota bacterium]